DSRGFGGLARDCDFRCFVFIDRLAEARCCAGRSRRDVWRPAIRAGPRAFMKNNQGEIQLASKENRKRVLLISNSTLYGSGYLDHAESEIRDFLGNTSEVLFIPYAHYDRDSYA